jgi:hypothetical protein
METLYLVQMHCPQTSAQLEGGAKSRIGINSDYAEENKKLLLNIIHRLERRIE